MNRKTSLKPLAAGLVAILCLLPACQDDTKKSQELETTASKDYKAWYTTHPETESSPAFSASTDAVRLHFYGWSEAEDSLIKVQFPESTVNYRRAILTYRMGGWNEGPAEWDMTTMIFVKNKLDGEWYELTRAITPYGGSFGSDWEKKYYMDITPYLPMLTGETEFRIYYGGWDATDKRAHTVTLTFDFYEGEIARPNVFHAKIYDSSRNTNTGYRSWAYGIDSASIEDPERLGQRTVTIPDNVKSLLLKVSISGHGHDQGTFVERSNYYTRNAAEFDENWYDIIINGEKRAEGHIFYSNADTYPQAGTYYYDRANWGPGLPLLVHYWDISNIPDGNRTLTIDFDLEEFRSAMKSPKDEGVAQYIVEVDLFGFSK
ncbi:MAG: hypothetical protein IAC51_00540 [bacterium]|uniref:Peptide-N-glycosidase F C-terminal domain-containing protein n=1 Tax=Candidatus Aphodosoma intestinipullorum TaxID=2840674 RepID=A0A940DI87_9BACT|nr:hypothetical protein [Candidatus Aphodosoma intestinipullorum]